MKTCKIFSKRMIARLQDEFVRDVMPAMTRRVISYALGRPDADYSARDLRLSGFDTGCTVMSRAGAAAGSEGGTRLGEIRLQVPGRHNLQNALAAVAVASELGVEFGRVAGALAEFSGAERRFQRRGEAGGVLVVDDYGHHPTEIAAVIAAARSALAGRRVVVVFQPHRFTRTRQLLDRFGPALREADEVVLTDIYPAGEEPIPGVTIDALAAAVGRERPGPPHLVRSLDDLPGAVARIARPGDVVITLGAGSVGGVGDEILEALKGAGPAAGREGAPCR